MTRRDEAKKERLKGRGCADDQKKPRTRGILSQSPIMLQLLNQVEQVAKTDASVLVLGETGVGKDLLARTIHALSPRHQQAFVSVNCATLPAGLVESELFGHEKGAFTSAVARHIGFFERAHKGTLFLDEIGDLPWEMQGVLLRILEENQLRRVGGTASIPVDVRIIAATNRDLQQAIQEGTFREDLYYRLSVFSVVVPPLRQRRADIPLLADHFVREYAQQLQRSVPPLSAEAQAYLRAYAWPGNVRQLNHWMYRMVILCKGERLELADVQAAEAMESASSAAAESVTSAAEGEDEPLAEGEEEKQHILAVHFGGPIGSSPGSGERIMCWA